jgi:hypothetical protein
MRSRITYKSHAGKRFGAGCHMVKIGPFFGQAVYLVAGRQRIYTTSEEAVAWLTRRGCPKPLAIELVDGCEITLHE